MHIRVLLNFIVNHLFLLQSKAFQAQWAFSRLQFSHGRTQFLHFLAVINGVNKTELQHILRALSASVDA